MASCAAYGCGNRPQRKLPGITFHKFPKNNVQKSKWILNVRRKNWMPSRHSRLCSKHFTEDQFDRTSLCYVRLKPNAVPTMFGLEEGSRQCQRLEGFSRTSNLDENISSQAWNTSDSNLVLSCDGNEEKSRKSTTKPLVVRATICEHEAVSSITPERSNEPKSVDNDVNTNCAPQSPTKEEYKRKLEESEKARDELSKEIKLLKKERLIQEKKIKSLFSLLVQLTD